MGFDVSEGAAYAVLYSVLGFFTILALGSAGWLGCLPSKITDCCTLKKKTNSNGGGGDGSTDNNNGKGGCAIAAGLEEEDGTGGAGGWLAQDHFLSARNSAGVWAIALSYFASGQGAWILYGTTEMGATPELSWLGVIGYSAASAAPALLIGWLGPAIRNMSEDSAFSTTDFARKRYGRIMQLVTGAVSVFYMFIYLVAELTSISNIFALFTNNASSTAYGIGISVSVGAITILYTTVAGLPASIVTDKFQGVMMAVLVIVLTAAVCAEPSNQVTAEEFAVASNWTADGFTAAVTLLLAIAAAEMFNQSSWQRVWAAESVPAMRRGFAVGSSFVFLVMMFFGVMGMIAYANDPVAYDTGEKYAFLAFFDLLEPLKTGWHVLVLILVTALAASSVDSLQNGMTCIFAADLVKIGWNPAWITRFLMIATNVPAVYLASQKYEVIPLFLVADLVCATAVFPVFLGLQRTDKLRAGVLTAPTEAGAFLGCVSGVGTVLVNGLVNDADGGLFNYFRLENGAICALCGTKTMVSFIVTPAVSAVMTYVFSFLDVLVRGDRARRPIIPISFDEESTSKVTATADEGDNDIEQNAVDDDDKVDKEVDSETMVAIDDTDPTAAEAEEERKSDDKDEDDDEVGGGHTTATEEEEEDKAEDKKRSQGA